MVRLQPYGILLTSLYLLANGVGGLAVIGSSRDAFRAAESAITALGYSPFVLFLSMMIIFLSATAGGAGLLLHARWGWWAAQYYLLYGVLRMGGALMQGPFIDAPGGYLFKWLVRGLIFWWLGGYLAHPDRAERFGLSPMEALAGRRRVWRTVSGTFGVLSLLNMLGGIF